MFSVKVGKLAGVYMKLLKINDKFIAINYFLLSIVFVKQTSVQPFHSTASGVTPNPLIPPSTDDKTPGYDCALSNDKVHG